MPSWMFTILKLLLLSLLKKLLFNQCFCYSVFVFLIVPSIFQHGVISEKIENVYDLLIAFILFRMKKFCMFYQMYLKADFIIQEKC